MAYARFGAIYDLSCKEIISGEEIHESAVSQGSSALVIMVLDSRANPSSLVFTPYPQVLSFGGIALLLYRSSINSRKMETIHLHFTSPQLKTDSCVTEDQEE